MFAELDGNRYRINFAYAVRSKNRKKPGWIWGAQKALQNIKGEFVRTFCDIAIREKDGWRSIAGDYSTRHPSDIFLKSEGRFVALNRTAAQIPDRKLRTAIFQAYYDRGGSSSREFTPGSPEKITANFFNRFVDKFIGR